MGDGLSSMPNEQELIIAEIAKAKRNKYKHNPEMYLLMVDGLEAKLKGYKIHKR